MSSTRESESDAGAPSDYDAIGGGPAVTVVVDRFYQLVLADPQLVAFFEGVDMARLKRHQAALVSQVLGGPVEYEGRELKLAHANLGIAADDFSAVVGHLVTALTETGVPSDIIGRAGAAVLATEPDVVEVPAARD